MKIKAYTVGYYNIESKAFVTKHMVFDYDEALGIAITLNEHSKLYYEVEAVLITVEKL